MSLPAAVLLSAVLTLTRPIDGLQCFDTQGRAVWVSYAEWLTMDMRGVLFCSVPPDDE